MGLFSSKVYPSEKIYKEIMKEIVLLIDKYKYWTMDEICPKLEPVYYDKLLRIGKDNIYGLADTIGIKQEDHYSQEDLCQLIINHFKKRLDLIKCIMVGINKASEILFRTRGGSSKGVCARVDTYVSTIEDCKSYGGLWIDGDQYRKMLKYVKGSEKYKIWKSTVEDLEEDFVKYLSRIKKIMKKVSDGEYILKSKEFCDFDSYSREVVRRMVYLCEIYYLLAVNVNLIQED